MSVENKNHQMEKSRKDDIYQALQRFLLNYPVDNYNFRMRKQDCPFSIPQMLFPALVKIQQDPGRHLLRVYG